jgi:hypothetical protein
VPYLATMMWPCSAILVTNEWQDQSHSREISALNLVRSVNFQTPTRDVATSSNARAPDSRSSASSAAFSPHVPPRVHEREPHHESNTPILTLATTHAVQAPRLGDEPVPIFST